MIRVTIENPERYWSTIQNNLRKSVGEGIRDIARIAANAAASATFPRGTSGKVRDSLHKGILKDVSRAYVPARSAEDENHAHYLQRHRNAKGRVNAGIRRKVISFESYERTKADLVRSAGTAKAGWLQAAASLSTKTRIPVWLRKNSALGYSRTTPRAVEVVNRVKYADRLLPAAQKRRILANAYAGYFKRAQRSI